MRILDKQKSTLPLTALGFSDENLTSATATASSEALRDDPTLRTDRLG